MKLSANTEAISGFSEIFKNISIRTSLTHTTRVVLYKLGGKNLFFYFLCFLSLLCLSYVAFILKNDPIYYKIYNFPVVTGIHTHTNILYHDESALVAGQVYI